MSSGDYNYFETDLNEITAYTLREFRLTMPAVELTIQYHDNLWYVNSDRAMIGRALLNICRQAAQLVPDTRELEVQSRNITLSHQFVEPYRRDPGDYVLVRITNRTAVMDENDVGQFLEPFNTHDKDLGMASAFGIKKEHTRSGFSLVSKLPELSNINF